MMRQLALSLSAVVQLLLVQGFYGLGSHLIAMSEFSKAFLQQELEVSKDAMQAASPAVTFRDKWIGSWRKRDNSSLKKSPPPPKIAI